MEGPGATVVDGMLYVNSGYGSWGGISGNVPAGLLGRREVIVDSQLSVGLNVKKFRMVVSGTDFDAGAQLLVNNISLSLESSSTTELVGQFVNALT